MSIFKWLFPIWLCSTDMLHNSNFFLKMSLSFSGDFHLHVEKKIRGSVEIQHNSGYTRSSSLRKQEKNRGWSPQGWRHASSYNCFSLIFYIPIISSLSLSFSFTELIHSQMFIRFLRTSRCLAFISAENRHIWLLKGCVLSCRITW